MAATYKGVCECVAEPEKQRLFDQVPPRPCRCFVLVVGEQASTWIDKVRSKLQLCSCTLVTDTTQTQLHTGNVPLALVFGIARWC